MSEPLGYLITLRTYGTWLHGDPRGSVDREHNTPGTPLLPRRGLRESYEARLLKHQPTTLNQAQRRAVHECIVEHCAARRWELHEVAVRTNHVHMVVANPGIPPENIIGKIKARVTRSLREHRFVAPNAHVWAAGGSRRYLWTADQVNAAAAYVRDGQDVPR